MKISEVKKGTEYALRQKYGDPRRVLAMDIVTVTEERAVYDNVLGKWKPRNVRKVKVKFLDAPAAHARWSTAKGGTDTVEARDLAAPWSEVGPNIKKRLEAEAAAANAREAMDKRLKKLLGRQYDGYVSMRGASPSYGLYGKSALKMLDLAEKGAAR